MDVTPSDKQGSCLFPEQTFLENPSCAGYILRIHPYMRQVPPTPQMGIQEPWQTGNPARQVTLPCAVLPVIGVWSSVAMEAPTKVAHSPGSVGCTEEQPSEPSLKRKSRSLPSGIEERKSSPGGENRMGVRESLGAGAVGYARACDPVGGVARDKARQASCGQILRDLVALLSGLYLRSLAMGSQERF